MHVLFWIAAGVAIGLTLGWASRPALGRALAVDPPARRPESSRSSRPNGGAISARRCNGARGRGGLEGAIDQWPRSRNADEVRRRSSVSGSGVERTS
jgi:hypothetical protein